MSQLTLLPSAMVCFCQLTQSIMLQSEYILCNEEDKDDKDGLLKYKDDKDGLLKDYALEVKELEVKPTNAKKAKKVLQQGKLWERCSGLIASRCQHRDTQGIC